MASHLFPFTLRSEWRANVLAGAAVLVALSAVAPPVEASPWRLSLYSQLCLVPCRSTCSYYSYGCTLPNCDSCLRSCESVCSGEDFGAVPDMFDLGNSLLQNIFGGRRGQSSLWSWLFPSFGSATSSLWPYGGGGVGVQDSQYRKPGFSLWSWLFPWWPTTYSPQGYQTPTTGMYQYPQQSYNYGMSYPQQAPGESYQQNQSPSGGYPLQSYGEGYVKQPRGPVVYNQQGSIGDNPSSRVYNRNQDSSWFNNGKNDFNLGSAQAAVTGSQEYRNEKNQNPAYASWPSDQQSTENKQQYKRSIWYQDQNSYPNSYDSQSWPTFYGSSGNNYGSDTWKSYDYKNQQFSQPSLSTDIQWPSWLSFWTKDTTTPTATASPTSSPYFSWTSLFSTPVPPVPPVTPAAETFSWPTASSFFDWLPKPQPQPKPEWQWPWQTAQPSVLETVVPKFGAAVSTYVGALAEGASPVIESLVTFVTNTTTDIVTALQEAQPVGAGSGNITASADDDAETSSTTDASNTASVEDALEVKVTEVNDSQADDVGTTPPIAEDQESPSAAPGERKTSAPKAGQRGNPDAESNLEKAASKR